MKRRYYDMCWYIYLHLVARLVFVDTSTATLNGFQLLSFLFARYYKTKNVDNFLSAHHERMHIVSCFYEKKQP